MNKDIIDSMLLDDNVGIYEMFIKVRDLGMPGSENLLTMSEVKSVLIDRFKSGLPVASHIKTYEENHKSHDLYALSMSDPYKPLLPIRSKDTIEYALELM